MGMIYKVIISIAVGGGLGFAYSKLVGCSTGACPLTSNPLTTTIFGAVLGLIIAINLK